MWSSELFCFAKASAKANAWKACSEPSLACRILPNMGSLPHYSAFLRSAAQLYWFCVLLRVRRGRGQQVARQIEGIGDHGGDDRARDDRGDQGRVLALIDDPARQPEQGRDRTKCQP